MTTITLQRDKCIGCNYCREHAPQRFAMSKKDGKAVLLHARERKGFYIVKVGEAESEFCIRAAKACPVKVIKVAE
ncbi:MAG: ferredoxin [Bacteroidetes bacterium]|nr:ferredoxin [Bacteroidota bacterium]